MGWKERTYRDITIRNTMHSLSLRCIFFSFIFEKMKVFLIIYKDFFSPLPQRGGITILIIVECWNMLYDTSFLKWMPIA